jgi:hypothetical protein
MQALQWRAAVKGFLVAVGVMAGIPALCRWIEKSAVPGYPAVLVSLLILLATVRLNASVPPFQPERAETRRGRAARRQRI